MKGHVVVLMGGALLLLSGADKVTCQSTEPDEPVCIVPADCEGLPHAAMVGEWHCLDGACVWEAGTATCLGQGEQYSEPATDAQCCPGLTPIEYAEYLDGECAYVNCLCYVCAACGNGACETGENPCNCPADCPLEGQCDDGSMLICTMVPPECPQGTIPAVQKGCHECVDPLTCLPPEEGCKVIKPGSHGMCEMVLGWIWDGWGCVLESGCGCGNDCPFMFDSAEECQSSCLGGKCIPEGEGFTEFADPPVQNQCCGEAVPVLLSEPSGYGQCVFPKCMCWVCIQCGNGECGPGEDYCTCPQDCGMPL